jgi:choline dehydrogenase-like flavoprotein
VLHSGLAAAESMLFLVPLLLLISLACSCSLLFDRCAQAAYDVIVIGGGSAGSGFSKRAAGYGAKVLLVDRGVARDGTGKRQGAGVGGTCVNVSVRKRFHDNGVSSHCSHESSREPTHVT